MYQMLRFPWDDDGTEKVYYEDPVHQYIFNIDLVGLDTRDFGSGNGHEMRVIIEGDVVQIGSTQLDAASNTGSYEDSWSAGAYDYTYVAGSDNTFDALAPRDDNVWGIS